MAVSQCKEEMLKYLRKENRPFSNIDVCNVFKNYEKTVINKAFDDLISDGLIKEKTYGKQKVYVIDQCSSNLFDEEELKVLEAEVARLSSIAAEEQQNLKHLSASKELKKTTSSLTKQEALMELSQVGNQLEQVIKEISRFKNKGPSVTENDFKKISETRLVMIKEWKKRKRIVMDIIDTVAEGYPKSKKQLISDIGIETDEECKCVLPQI